MDEVNVNLKEEIKSLKETVEKKIDQIRNVRIALDELKEMPMGLQTILNDEEVWGAFVDRYENIAPKPTEIKFHKINNKKLKYYSTEKLIAQLRKRGLIVTVYELKNI